MANRIEYLMLITHFIKAPITTNVPPVRKRLFCEQPVRKQRGIDGFVVGEFHPRKQTQVVSSSIHNSTSPMIHKSQQKQSFQDSPSRAKQKINRFKSKLDFELQLQNTGIIRMSNNANYQSGPLVMLMNCPHTLIIITRNTEIKQSLMNV